MMYVVQSRKRGDAWKTRWSFDDLNKALHSYMSLNTFGDYRKRFIEISEDGTHTITINQLDVLPWRIKD